MILPRSKIMSLPPEIQKVLSDLEQSVLAPWVELHSEIPLTLYHYTSAEGLVGILSSQSIWLTDLRYVNDMSELQYARKLVESRLVEIQKGALSDVQKEFVERFTRAGADPYGFGHSVFSASFCEKGNLLSQWRAYRGVGGGYALGFDFLHLLPTLDRPCVLRKVIYEPADQAAQVDGIINTFLQVIDAESRRQLGADFISGVLPHICQLFRAILGEYLFAFKHPEFREEQEWRLVHAASNNPTMDRKPASDTPKFRCYAGNIVPYVHASFSKGIEASRNDVFGRAFPIVETIIGPTVSSELNSDSIKMLLLSMNPDFEPNIRSSGIPLRWL